jgi:hypothetical protein
MFIFEQYIRLAAAEVVEEPVAIVSTTLRRKLSMMSSWPEVGAKCQGGSAGEIL